MKKRKPNKLTSSLTKLYSYVEKSLTTTSKTAIGFALLLIVGYSASTLFQPTDLIESTVKITNTIGNSGGSGVILSSSSSGSIVLTNAHVCRVVEYGGKVTSKTGSFLVSGYKKSNLHDLCMIEVKGDLGVSTPIAFSAPRAYYEEATISGHPRLLPNVVTRGHFSGTAIISVLVRFDKCEAGNKDLRCIFFGGIPVIKNYESTLVTATIMPGSSGSGVYNKDDKLVGLAFAGSNGLGYAWTVPYEYLTYFVYREAKTLSYTSPSNIVGDGQAKKRNTELFHKASHICNTSRSEMPLSIQKTCDVIVRTPWLQ